MKTLAAVEPRLTAGIVLQPASGCVVRRQQQEGFLIYNSTTDEMHLVSSMGYYIYQLCDSIRSVGEIEALLAPDSAASPGLEDHPVRAFLAGLVARQVLEIAANA